MVVVVGARAGMSIPQGPRSDDAADDDGTGYGDGSDGGWRTWPLLPLLGWVACPVCPSVDATCRVDQMDQKSVAVAARVATFSSVACTVTVGGH